MSPKSEYEKPMSTSLGENSTSAARGEPIKSLMAAIARARELPAPPVYESPVGDPLARLRRTMAGEVDAPAGAPSSPAPARTAAAASSGSAASSAPPGGEAVVGREVLAVLRAQPLDGPARAAAVERLAAQIAAPEPAALREVLAILLTGRADLTGRGD